MFESSVLDPKGVADDGSIIISECLGIVLVMDVNTLEETEEVNCLLVFPPFPVSKVPVQVVVNFSSKLCSWTGKPTE